MTPDGSSVSQWLQIGKPAEANVRNWIHSAAAASELNEFLSASHGYHSLDPHALARIKSLSEPAPAKPAKWYHHLFKTTFAALIGGLVKKLFD